MSNKTELKEYPFKSLSYKILTGVSDYYCVKHGIDLRSNYLFHTDIGTCEDSMCVKDIDVEENKSFNYQIIVPEKTENTKKITFLFHGFNEKNWDKYIPWAKTICERTGSSVVLFPIAFHMQRAPKTWSNAREMYKLSESRKKRYPNIVDSTLSNVAISMRLHSMPQRFIWSGLQTYYDVIQFIEDCKEGRHPYIHKDFEFDIFAYSIGGFLALILKLTDYKNYFPKTKVCLFCSGATFNRLSSVSKYILDSEASVALYSFLVEHLDAFLQKDNLLKHYMLEDHLEGKIFYSMLDYQKGRLFREEMLKKHANDIYAITLQKDKVVPSFEVINTLKGAYRDIDIQVDELDFDRKYTHENPFPSPYGVSKQVDDDFETVFTKVGNFYRQ